MRSTCFLTPSLVRSVFRHRLRLMQSVSYPKTPMLIRENRNRFSASDHLLAACPRCAAIRCAPLCCTVPYCRPKKVWSDSCVTPFTVTHSVDKGGGFKVITRRVCLGAGWMQAHVNTPGSFQRISWLGIEIPFMTSVARSLPEVKPSDAAMSPPCLSEWFVVKCMIETLSIMAATGGAPEHISFIIRNRLSSYRAYCPLDITPQVDNITSLCETLLLRTTRGTFIDVIMLLRCYMKNGPAAIALCHFSGIRGSDFETDCTSNVYFVLSDLRNIFEKLKQKEVPIATEFPLPCAWHLYPRGWSFPQDQRSPI